MQIKTLIAVLSVVASSIAIPLGEAEHDHEKRAIKYPQDLVFGTMTKCDHKRFQGVCTQDTNVQDSTCRKVKIDAMTFAPGRGMTCQIWFDNDKCQGQAVEPFTYPGVQDWEANVWGAAVSDGKSPKSYKCKSG